MSSNDKKIISADMKEAIELGKKYIFLQKHEDWEKDIIMVSDDIAKLIVNYLERLDNDELVSNISSEFNNIKLSTKDRNDIRNIILQYSICGVDFWKETLTVKPSHADFEMLDRVEEINTQLLIENGKKVVKSNKVNDWSKQVRKASEGIYGIELYYDAYKIIAKINDGATKEEVSEMLRQMNLSGDVAVSLIDIITKYSDTKIFNKEIEIEVDNSFISRQSNKKEIKTKVLDEATIYDEEQIRELIDEGKKHIVPCNYSKWEQLVRARSEFDGGLDVISDFVKVVELIDSDPAILVNVEKYLYDKMYDLAKLDQIIGMLVSFSWAGPYLVNGYTKTKQDCEKANIEYLKKAINGLIPEGLVSVWNNMIDTVAYNYENVFALKDVLEVLQLAYDGLTVEEQDSLLEKNNYTEETSKIIWSIVRFYMGQDHFFTVDVFDEYNISVRARANQKSIDDINLDLTGITGGTLKKR